ncbi:hypothetical protein LguiB_009497 [Lonicera macranthoides]
MGKEGVALDRTTIVVVLKACLGLEDYDLAIQVHGKVVQMGFDLDVVAGSAIVDMYAKFKKLKVSIHFFDEMPEKNWVSWSALIAGCVQNDEYFSGLELFKKMQNESVRGVQVHGLAIKSSFCSNVCVANAIMDMYGKCGALVEARGVFDEMERSDAISWNAIIAAYEQNGKEEETLSLFVWMLRSRMEPDGIVDPIIHSLDINNT